MVQTVLFYGAMTLLAAFLTAWAKLPSLFTPPELGRGLAATAVAVALSLAVVFGGRRLEGRPWYARMADIVRTLVRHLLGPAPKAADIIIVATASSLGEESLFRGFVQPGLARFLTHRLPDHDVLPGALAVLLTATLFAAIHPPLHRDLRPWTMFAFCMGLAWGAITLWSGSLAPAIAGHFLVNGLNLRRLACPPPPC